MPAAPRSAPATASDPDPRERTAAALDEFLTQQRAVLLSVSAHLAEVDDLISSALGGGKMLRPLFCYWGWRSAGAPGDDPGLFRAAASLELLQACALVHDDVIDASDTRRGQPAAHRRLQRHHETSGWAGDAARFGTAAAILVGDLLLAWSDELFTASGLAPEAIRAGRPVFDVMRTEVMAGQYLDVVVQSQANPDPGAIADVLRYKSAKYSVERPLQLGAALGGADDRLLAGLSAFGLPLGEAFQLRDDLLGVFGDPKVTGKPAGDDLREGKRTMLLAHAHARADAAQRSILHQLGKPDLQPEHIQQLKAVLIATGAVARVERDIEDRRARALAALDDLRLEPKSDAALRSMAKAVTDRDR